MRTSIVILNYNNSNDTIDCINSISKSLKKPFLIVIVDNASSDGSYLNIRNALENSGHQISELRTATPAHAEQLAREVPYPEKHTLLIQAIRNRGYAAGNNLGIAAAFALGSDAIWILNNDTLVAPNALEAMEERLARGNGRIGLCGSLIRYADEADMVQCCGGGYTNEWTLLSHLAGNGLSAAQAKQLSPQDIERDINFIYGASVMASRTFLERVGLMDERFFLYCEEQDWAWRGRRHGFSLGYARDAEVWHKEGATSGMNKRSRPLRRMLQLTRSRLLLAGKHRPLSLPVVATGCLFAACRLVWTRLARQ